MNKTLQNVFWVLVAVLAAWCFGVLALNQGETISATWLVVASVCIYLIGYRFYSKFIAEQVFELDDNRATPAVVNNDGKDFVPTHKAILFGHHFAAIAGAGPLVGPILAAQMGYLPSMIWLLVGVVLAGAVHDFAVLFISMRRNGRSLGEMIKDEMGKVTGGTAMIGILFIMFIIVAILAMVVVNALAESPWGLFTIAMTIPIAVLMGVYMRFIRPGRVGEASIIGFVLLILALYYGHAVNNPDHPWHSIFLLNKITLAWIVIAYGFIASVLPVWLLLAPRDYLSTFLKIGVIVIMAAGILIANPDLQLGAVSNFIDGTGPVFAGSIFPFLFITIACGAISGFHALISSGTSPKMIEKESHARLVGYGSMLMESLVGIMALVAACILEPGLYFAINTPLATLDPMATGTLNADLATVEASLKNILQNGGFVLTPELINETQNSGYIANLITKTAVDVGEQTLLSRTGGAPTFAVGLTHILHQIVGGKESMAFWYHFAILFEALFILTAVDAGTRTGRFLIQDILGNLYKPMADTKSYTWGILASFICVCGWGYLLYQGVIDPKGGIFTLWPLFGAANQMLAGIALLLATVILFKMGKTKYAFVTILPAFWVLLTTLWASLQKILPMNGERIHDAVSHVAAVQKALAVLNDPNATQKALDIAAINFHNNLVDAVLCALFMIVVFVVLFETIKICYLTSKGEGADKWPLKEEPYKKASDYEPSY
ncbi:carbon starvation CstA family protein [Campylobacter sp. MIT 97-5078]|uniref:carbon starvation CstA family protein n=1 Tax=Campylobacter sp. MIT 97-5078 TaxID=1548153 RepID=UPI0005147177|nr:carbon starvation CstA family protein [Campylobacter sp. MIT 97-5078]KGI56302.1 carbon starvation protein A [Campylobacter sp. MIT 97-5078]KGI57569.1 carbon starvation protein A [Campylobacter sp. MIT 97-5078]KGI57734.1 carbon starvation protein A [Campylobacter sp. MIT 97-5078]TQR26909.1 carbon starvation protein A [Campylobacter sp. MIT 97-5078]